MASLQDHRFFGIRRGTCIAFALAMGPLIYLGFHLGANSRRQTTHSNAEYTRFRVRGQSMAPTLMDGQKCILEHLDGTETLRHGDLVAIKAADGIRVKRLAALPGDLVDVADGRLTVNGNRLESLLRARTSDFIPPALVQVIGMQPAWNSVPGLTHWWVYQHRDPHRGGRPGPVVDDYPQNEALSRRLYPVDRLIVRMRLLNGVDSIPRRVGFHRDSSERVGVCETRKIAPMEFEADSADSIAADASLLPLTSALDPTKPFAIEGLNVPDSLNIELMREIEYRDDRPKLDYPITLASDSFFIVGDNVPVSVDSRSTGPIQANSILGKITNPSFPDRP